MWIKQKSGSALFKMHSRKNIIVQQYAGTGHTVFWLFFQPQKAYTGASQNRSTDLLYI